MDEESIYATRRLDSELDKPEPAEETPAEEEFLVTPPPLPEPDDLFPPPLPETEAPVVMTPPLEEPFEAVEVIPTTQPEVLTFGSSEVAPGPEIPSPFDEVESEPVLITPPPVPPASGGGRQPVVAPVTPTATGAKPPKKDNTVLIIVIVVAVLLLLCCCCIAAAAVFYPIAEEFLMMGLLGAFGLLL